MFASLLKKRTPRGSKDPQGGRRRLPDEDKLQTSGGGEGRPARATASSLSKPPPDFAQDVASLPSGPVRLCFAHAGDEWCGDVRPQRGATVEQSQRSIRDTLCHELPSLAAAPPELITAVREGAYGPLYPLALLAAAPSLFAPPAGTDSAELPPWVVAVAPRADEPFANHSDPSGSTAVSYASLLKGRGSGAEYDDAAAELLAQMQRHGWARVRVPREEAALVRSLTQTARTLFGLADSVKERAQKKCPYTGKFWGWAREQKFLAGGEAAILPRYEKRHLFLSFPMFVPSLSWQNDRFYISVFKWLKNAVFHREYFMVRKEVEDFTPALPWVRLATAFTLYTLMYT